MSKASKQLQRKKIAMQFSALRKNGDHGPAKTEPKHGKNPNNRWRAVAERIRVEAERKAADEARKAVKAAQAKAKPATAAPAKKPVDAVEVTATAAPAKKPSARKPRAIKSKGSVTLGEAAGL